MKTSLNVFTTTAVCRLKLNQTPQCTVNCSTGKLFKSKTHALKKCRKLNAIGAVFPSRRWKYFSRIRKLSLVAFNMHNIFIDVHAVYGLHQTRDNYAWNSRRNKQKLNNAPAVEQHFSSSCFIVWHVCCSVCKRGKWE